MRPSRFGLVLFSGILLLAAVVLVCIQLFIQPRRNPDVFIVLNDPTEVEQYEKPAFPTGIIEKYGQPYHVVQSDWSWQGARFRREVVVGLGDRETASTLGWYFGEFTEIGYPIRCVSTQGVFYQLAHGTGTVWPEEVESEWIPAVTYHPLGLILNPIIYALPIWLIVMGVRWAFVTRRSRKRARLGLCVGCAYELAGLGVCPECGRERG